MARQLTVNGDVFNYPESGERKGWGEDATDWAEAVTDVVNSVTGTGFIPETTITINDNVSVFTNILGANFNSSVTRSFKLTYAVRRTNGATPIAETGTIEGVFGDSDWDFSIQRTGDAGMEFTLTSGGQIQYKSTSVGGTYSGDITFYANVIAE